MADAQFSAEVLLNLGFVDVGYWRPSGDFLTYQLDGENTGANETLLDDRNALYAYVVGEEVLYVGKTARSIRKRFVGYCRPGKRQATNLRCHRNIKANIAQGREIRIFIFAPITHLRYAEFEINLAAGLEDSLIQQFNPPWNGREKGIPVSEDAEREEAEEASALGSAPMSISPQAGTEHLPELASFSIVLGPTYYGKGFLNPGIEASRFLGKDGDPVRVRFSNRAAPIMSKINRTANRSGAVRIVGGNQLIAAWFQENFQEGATVHGLVRDHHTIELQGPDSPPHDFR